MCCLQAAAGPAALFPQPLGPAHAAAPHEAAELAGVLAGRRLPAVPGGPGLDAGLWAPGPAAGRTEALDGGGGSRLLGGALVGGGDSAGQPLAGHGALLGAAVTGGRALRRGVTER